MDGQVSFDEWFMVNGAGLGMEARRLMQMSWNGALTNGDKHFFVAELAEAIRWGRPKDVTWGELIEAVKSLKAEKSDKPLCEL